MNGVEAHLSYRDGIAPTSGQQQHTFAAVRSLRSPRRVYGCFMALYLSLQVTLYPDDFDRAKIV